MVRNAEKPGVFSKLGRQGAIAFREALLLRADHRGLNSWGFEGRGAVGFGSAGEGLCCRDFRDPILRDSPPCMVCYT